MAVDIHPLACNPILGLGKLGRQAFLETEMSVCVYGKIFHAVTFPFR